MYLSASVNILSKGSRPRLWAKLTAHAKNLRFLSSSVTEDVPTVLMTWGVGTDGQLGHGRFGTEKSGFTMEDVYIQNEPRKLVRSKRFKNVCMGETFTLGLTTNGHLFGWGKGFINHSTEAQSNEPVPIMDAAVQIASISAGPQHAAAVDVSGQVYTWGHGGSWLSGGGQLGHGSRDHYDKPTLIEAFRDYGAQAAMVACGKQHTIILTDDGEVLSCGVGEYGLLGTGSTMDSTVPVPVEALEDVDVVQVAAGFDHTLVLTAEGTIYSWGRNNSGQLGHSDSNMDIYSMEDFPRLIDMESLLSVENEEDMQAEGQIGQATIEFTQVAAGNGRSAAVSSDGLLYVWGNRLSHQPRLMSKGLFGGQRVQKVQCGGDAGRAAFLVLTEDGALWTFGDAKSRLLGMSGLKGKYAEPLLVESLGNRVVDVACGFGQHAMAFVKLSDDSAL